MNPPFRLSARDESRGGALVPVHPRGSSDPRGKDLLTIFVHGYNNEEYRALARWDDRTWPVLQRMTSHSVDGVALFFWPGDSGEIRPLSGARYPSRVRVAIAAGVELGRYLRKIAPWNRGLQVQFVGHSLGCRVVLSAVHQLAESPRTVPVVATLLMGAAVPEGDCGPAGPWSTGTAAAFGVAATGSGSSTGDVVLFSSDDTVLNREYRIGEWLARRSGVASVRPFRAVGLTGQPRERWSGQAQSCGLQHDDYPRHEKSLRYVAAMFGPLIEQVPAEQLPGASQLAEMWPGERRHESRRLATVPSLG